MKPRALPALLFGAGVLLVVVILTQALEEVRNRTFLAWDDDSGEGYAAALQYVVSTPGDYVLIAWGALSAFGRLTSGDYELPIGLDIAGRSTRWRNCPP